MPARTNTATATTPPVKSAGQRNPALDRVLPSLDFNAPAEMQLQAMQRAKDYLATQVGDEGRCLSKTGSCRC
jgi:hypothetical protein